MSCFIEITNGLSKLEHYSEIIKISELLNKILQKTEQNIYTMKKKLRLLVMAS